MTLLDQIKWVVAGHNVDDVAAVAIMLLEECCVQASDSNAHAHHMLNNLSSALHDAIDRDYAELKAESNGILAGQKS